NQRTRQLRRAANETGQSVFLSRRSGSSESEISLSMDLQQNSWLPELSRSPVFFGSSFGVGVWAKARFSRNGMGAGKSPAPPNALSLRLSANQLLDFAFLRS